MKNIKLEETDRNEFKRWIDSIKKEAIHKWLLF